MSAELHESGRFGKVSLPSGAEISYRMLGREGVGVPLLLLPAVGGGARAWGPFAERLSTQRWLVALDPPGFGNSSAPGLRSSTRRIASELSGCVARLGLDHFDVFGISLGSLLGCWLGILAAPRARRLVLASCAAKGLRFAPRSLSSALRLAADLSHRKPKQAVAGDLTARPDSPGTARARAGAATDEWPRSRLLHFLSMALAHAPGSRLRELEAPVLLVHGDRDPILSRRSQLELLGILPNARLETLAGVGHDLVAEAPSALAELSLKFFRETEASCG